MPEGPEVCVVADMLHKMCTGKTIISQIHTPEAKLKGDVLILPSTITLIKSHGKKILFYLDTGFVMVFSLGLTGGFQSENGNHCRTCFTLVSTKIDGRLKILSKDEETLYFRDKIRYGSIMTMKTTNLPPYLESFGPDLLQLSLADNTKNKNFIELDEWISIFSSSKKRLICDILIDQKYVAGIGWYLVIDILYSSNVHPNRIVSTITREEWDKIRINAFKIMKQSYLVGGHTFESFAAPDGTTGGYKSLIYKQQFDPLGNQVLAYKVTKGSLSKNRTCYVVSDLQF